MKLREIHIKGFKSIDGDAGQTIRFGDVTVLLGANGSGKSNLVSFFKMIGYMVEGALGHYVGKHGVSRLLFYGPKQTKSISIDFIYLSDTQLNEYSAILSHGLPDRLFYSFEKAASNNKISRNVPNPSSDDFRDVFNDFNLKEYVFDIGKSESALKRDDNETSKSLYTLLSGIRTYQFHDTSDTAAIKDRGNIDDAKFLHGDGGNLAAFLKMLKEYAPYEKYYKRIVRHIQVIMPQFSDFDLEPLPGNKDYVRLNWKDASGSDYLFDPHQISDGSLRFMALATLLLQPPDLLPKFIVLDEPELGLHPAAIAELGGLVKIATENAQVLLATQSTRLVDEFLLDEIVIVERDEQKQCSIFKKLDAEQLKNWLEHYSLSELWEKNVLGGQP